MNIVFAWLITGGFFYLTCVGIKAKLRERALRKARERYKFKPTNLPVPTIDGGLIHGERIDEKERSYISYGG